MISVPASEVQKKFGEWHDRAHEQPVEITKYGRTTAFLVSAPLFRAMWSSYRQALPVGALTQQEVDLIAASRIEEGKAYSLDDIKDNEDSGR